MGLDIFTGSFDIDYDELFMEIEEYLNEGIMPKLEEHYRKDEYDAIFKILEDDKSFNENVSYKIEEFKLIKKFIESEELANEDDMRLASEYEWVYEGDDISDSRMGSYSTIHYGRFFAYLFSKYCDENNIDIVKFTPTREIVESLLLEQHKSSNTGYVDNYFNNICEHSDCGGYYIPTQRRVSFKYGSSILLLKELDLLYKSGVVDILKEITTEVDNKYGVDNYYNYSVPKSLKSKYIIASNVEWVFRKLLYHAVESVEEDTIITFC